VHYATFLKRLSEQRSIRKQLAEKTIQIFQSVPDFIHRFSPSQFSCTLLAAGKLKIHSDTFFNPIWLKLRQQDGLDSFDMKQLALTLNALTKLANDSTAIFEAAEQWIIAKKNELTQTCDIESIGLLANAFQHKKRLSGPLVHALEEIVLPHLHRFEKKNYPQFAMLVLAVGRSGHATEPFMSHLQKRLLFDQAEILYDADQHSTAMIIAGFAESGHMDEALFTIFEVRLLATNGHLRVAFAAESITLMASALSKTQAPIKDLFTAFENYLLTKNLIKSLDYFNRVLLISAFQRVRQGRELLFMSAIDENFQNEGLKTLDIHALNMLIHSLSTRASDTRELFYAAGECLIKLTAASNDPSIVQKSHSDTFVLIAVAFAKKNYITKRYFDCFEDNIAVEEHSTRHLALAAHAFSAEGTDRALFATIKRRLLTDGKKLLQSANATDLAMLANAFSKKVSDESSFLEDIAQEFLKKIDEANAQDCSDMVKVFNKTHLPRTALFQAIAKRLLHNQCELLHKASGTDIAIFVLGYSMQDFNVPILFSQIQQLVVDRPALLHECTPVELSYIVTGFAKQKKPHKALFKTVEEQLLEHNLLDTLKEDIGTFSSVMVGFSNRNYIYGSERLFTAFQAALLLNQSLLLQKCDGQDLVHVAMAFARTGFFDPNLIIHLYLCIRKISIAGFSAQEMTQLLWALSIFGVYKEELFVSFLEAIHIRTFSHNQQLGVEQLNQLCQVRMATQIEEPNFDLSWSERLLQDMGSVAQDTHISLTQRDIFETSCRTRSGGFLDTQIASLSVDIFYPEENLVIEFHGPQRFVEGTKLNGPSQFKQRLLEQMGYHYVIISKWDLSASPTQKEQTLTSYINHEKLESLGAV